MREKTLTFLENNSSKTESKWKQEAQWRQDNKSWLIHSQKIAVKILLSMKQHGLTQLDLAQKINCTQQYISKILKGRENISLETLTKLEEALDICLINDDSSSIPAEDVLQTVE